MRMEFSSSPAIQWPANTGQSILISSSAAALAPFAHHFRTGGSRERITIAPILLSESLAQRDFA
jgi:hypothetical protein